MTLTDWIAAFTTLGVLGAVWWPIRMLIAQREEQRFEEEYPRNADGIIMGAEPIHVRGVRPGAVLLFHGYNDSPQTVSSLAEVLHDHGWTVRAPLLPGHGRTLQEFSRSGAQAWIEGARAEYGALRSRHEAVAVGGLSMGAALAMLLAAEHRDIRAVFGIAPYLSVSLPMRLLLAVSPVAEIGARYMSVGGGSSVRDPKAAARIIAYRTSTPRLGRELGTVAVRANAVLPRVNQPVLVVHSREDNRISSATALRAFERIGASDKTLEWTNGAGHILTVDYGHEQLERRIVEWLSTRL